jgi:hypothetical protein
VFDNIAKFKQTQGREYRENIIIIILIIITIIKITIIIAGTIMITNNVSKHLKSLETIPGQHSIDSLQKIAVVRTSHIIRKVLPTI